jgi:spermidine/putrescine transport system permease protein
MTDAAATASREDAGERAMRALLTAVAYGAPLVFILVPLILFLLQSFYSMQDNEIVHRLTLANYVRFFSEATFIPVFFYTCLLSLGAALITLVLGYPVALLLASLTGRLKYTLTLVFVIPLLMSYIMKIYAIRSLLGGNGFLNRMLIAAGIIDQPITFLIFNLYAVMITLALILLPFTMLPIFITLDKIPRQLVDASYDLGATGWQTFRRVILPLSMSGTLVGVSFTFVLGLGDFVTPQMVGGMNGLTFGRIIYSQFGFAFNWPFGAALSVILLVFVAVVLLLTGRLFMREGGATP